MNKLNKKDSDMVFYGTLNNLTEENSKGLVNQIDRVVKNLSMSESIHPTAINLMIMTTWLERMQSIHTKDVALDTIVKLIKIVIDDPAEFLDRYIPLVEDDLIEAGRAIIHNSDEVVH